MIKGIRGIMTLISMVLVAQIMLSLVVSWISPAHAPSEEEFHSLFMASTRHSLPDERSTEYCNAPNNKVHGLEGVPPRPGMKLVGAVVMVRHGDRLPISRPPVLSNVSPINNRPCRMDPTAHPSNPLLQPYMEAVMTYGSLIKSHLDPVMQEFDLLPDTCSDVSITQTGIVQMLEVGKFLGDRYISKELDPKEVARNVVPVTSRFARTFQSLFPVLYGMSPTAFSELVESRVGTSTSLYFCDSDLPTMPSSNHCDCPKAKSIPYLRAGFRHWDTKQPSINFLYKILKIADGIQPSQQEKKIGPTPLAVTSPSRVWDWLVSDYFCSRRDLPCFENPYGKDTVCLNSTVIGDLIRLVDKNHLRMVTDKTYKEAADLAMYPFLNTVRAKFEQLLAAQKSTMKQKVNKASEPFLWILSGHDITLGPLSVALGMPLLKKAPYATRVSFELWTGCGDSESKCNDVSDVYIRVLWNGKVAKISSITQEDVNDLMPFSLFDGFMRNYLASYNFTHYDAACAL